MERITKFTDSNRWVKMVENTRILWYNQFDKRGNGNIVMSKSNDSNVMIYLLAYFHRYGWIVATIACSAIWAEQAGCIFCAAFFIFSIWSFVGYKCKWKHIYCSYQNAYHEKMTPKRIYWHRIKKSDAYGVPSIFFSFGIILLIMILC